jgi:hypothetical protein
VARPIASRTTLSPTPTPSQSRRSGSTQSLETNAWTIRLGALQRLDERCAAVPGEQVRPLHPIAPRVIDTARTIVAVPTWVR